MVFVYRTFLKVAYVIYVKIKILNPPEKSLLSLYLFTFFIWGLALPTVYITLC